MAELSSLTISIRVPEPSERGAPVQVRPLVDGRDVIAELFDEHEDGRTCEPESLFEALSPLRAEVEPREVQLVEAACSERCCGALYVTIRREGSHVVWDGWQNPGGLEAEPAALRFAASQYDREVARAQHDHGWEWPARSVARMLTSRLRAVPELLARWDCELYWASAWPWDRDRVNVSVMTPRVTVPAGEPWVQFRIALKVDGEAPEVQADRFAALLTDNDPRDISAVCGGSQAYAEQLGYTWRG